MSTGTIVFFVGVVIVLAIVGAVVAFILLYGLATQPERFRVRRLCSSESVPGYFEKAAAFAITITVNTPLTRAEVWQRLTGEPYLTSLPFLTGPIWIENSENELPGRPLAVGARRWMSGTILSVTQEVVAVVDRETLTLTGTAISIPLAIDSFAERFTLTDARRGTIDVRWEIAGTPRWVGWLPWRWGAPLLRPILAYILRHILRLKPFSVTSQT